MGESKKIIDRSEMGSRVELLRYSINDENVFKLIIYLIWDKYRIIIW